MGRTLSPDEARRMATASLITRTAKERQARDQLIRDVAAEAARTAIREYVAATSGQAPGHE